MCNSLGNKICNLYKLGLFVSAKKIDKGYSHINYKLTTNKGFFIVKIYRNKKIKDILYEISLTNALKTFNISTPTYIKNSKNRYIFKNNNKYLTISLYIEGFEPKINEKTIQLIGIELAKINNFKKWRLFYRENPRGMLFIKRVVLDAQKTKVVNKVLINYCKEELKQIEPYVTKDYRKGVIHGDFFTDNLLFDKNGFKAVLDFDGAGIDNTLFDVSMTILGLCFNKEKLNKKLLLSFLNGYQKVRVLSDLELNNLKYFTRYSLLVMVCFHINQILKYNSDKSLKRAFFLLERKKDITNLNRYLE